MSTTTFANRFLAALGLSATSTPTERVSAIRQSLAEHRAALTALDDERTTSLADSDTKAAGARLSLIDGESAILRARIASAEELLTRAVQDQHTSDLAQLESELATVNERTATDRAACSAAIIAALEAGAACGMDRSAICSLYDSAAPTVIDQLQELRFRAQALGRSDYLCGPDSPSATSDAVQKLLPAARRNFAKNSGMAGIMQRAEKTADALEQSRRDAEVTKLAKAAEIENDRVEFMQRLHAEMVRLNSLNPMDVAKSETATDTARGVYAQGIQRLGENGLPPGFKGWWVRFNAALARNAPNWLQPKTSRLDLTRIALGMPAMPPSP